MSVESLLESVQEQLYSESTVAKIWGIAKSKLDLTEPPTKMPEYSHGKYHFRDIDHWTAGFFPGSVAALLERRENYPEYFTPKVHPIKLEYAARWWSESLIDQAPRTDTHDLSFIIQPAFEREYKRCKSEKAFECLKTAAYALASRFDERVGVIRSWDTAVNKRYSFNDKESDFIVIIDNMCNLDMLYYVASITGDVRLSTIATTHALSTVKNHFRLPEWSTYHVVNYNPVNGLTKAKFTNQGYDDETTWARGQAWAVLGFAETYGWTKQKVFLEAAVGAAQYFLSRIGDDGVPAWDFDAPDPDIKDTSAAMITVLGLIKIFEHTGEKQHLNSGLKLLKDTIAYAYDGDAKISDDGKVDLGEVDAILKHATINNNPDTYERLVDHGLVYGDYYFLCIGNKLLELGLISKS
ncbi:CIC11C00000003027 [Sungouiella intermedia]|uniref:CIC11C00000003027 n=1 Tax=Sungouiella intermedia TaxID=45354 RepID=A0A1L0FYN4_9ASCO|nr:CIC11C00000003027 [[Candida] intermedia]